MNGASFATVSKKIRQRFVVLDRNNRNKEHLTRDKRDIDFIACHDGYFPFAIMFINIVVHGLD